MVNVHQQGIVQDVQATESMIAKPFFDDRTA
jgi:hypothetical protein